MCLNFLILSTYRTFQVSSRKVRSGGKRQDQEAVVVADNIEKIDEASRQAENKVTNKELIIVQNSAFH